VYVCVPLSNRAAWLDKKAAAKAAASLKAAEDAGAGVVAASAPTGSLPNPAGALQSFSSTESPFSVVIVALDEPLLTKTVHAVLNTLGNDRINEVLVVDDYGLHPVEYSQFPADRRVHIYRAPHRLGLIEARDTGGRLARGPYLVFIDAHCRPHEHWLYPVQRLLDDNHRRLVNMQVGMLNGTSWKQMYPGRIGRYSDRIAACAVPPWFAGGDGAICG
jgi:hypothetical protein